MAAAAGEQGVVTAVYRSYPEEQQEKRTAAFELARLVFPDVAEDSSLNALLEKIKIYRETHPDFPHDIFVHNRAVRDTVSHAINMLDYFYTLEYASFFIEYFYRNLEASTFRERCIQNCIDSFPKGKNQDTLETFAFLWKLLTNGGQRLLKHFFETIPLRANLEQLQEAVLRRHSFDPSFPHMLISSRTELKKLLFLHPIIGGNLRYLCKLSEYAARNKKRAFFPVIERAVSRLSRHEQRQYAYHAETFNQSPRSYHTNFATIPVPQQVRTGAAQPVGADHAAVDSSTSSTDVLSESPNSAAAAAASSAAASTTATSQRAGQFAERLPVRSSRAPEPLSFFLARSAAAAFPASPAAEPEG